MTLVNVKNVSRTIFSRTLSLFVIVVIIVPGYHWCSCRSRNLLLRSLRDRCQCQASSLHHRHTILPLLYDRDHVTQLLYSDGWPSRILRHFDPVCKVKPRFYAMVRWLRQTVFSSTGKQRDGLKTRPKNRPRCPPPPRFSSFPPGQ